MPNIFSPMPQPDDKIPVRPGMADAIRETPHRFMAAGLGVNALRVFLRQSFENLDFAAGEAITLRVRFAHRAATAFRFDRRHHIAPHRFERFFQALREAGIVALDPGAVAARKSVSFFASPILDALARHGHHLFAFL